MPKNGDRSDNRAENLELWDGQHRKGQRVSDLLDEIERLRIRVRELEQR